MIPDIYFKLRMYILTFFSFIHSLFVVLYVSPSIGGLKLWNAFVVCFWHQLLALPQETQLWLQ